MNNTIIPIKFRDLINELANLCDMNSKNDVIGFYITTSVCYYGRYDLEELIKLMNDKNFNFRYDKDYLHLILYGKKNNKFIFFYNIKLRLNLSEKEVNGKSLLDHLEVVKGNSDLKNLNYSKLDINNDVDNLILYFDKSNLSRKECRDFYPLDLFNNAVYNCYNADRKIKKK